MGAHVEEAGSIATPGRQQSTAVISEPPTDLDGLDPVLFDAPRAHGRAHDRDLRAVGRLGRLGGCVWG
jgi:hypothetical protein